VLDFTDERAKLHDALFRIQPRLTAGAVMAECPEVSYYMADLIIDKNDGQAMQAATQEAMACFPPAAAPMAAKAEAFRQLAMGNQESRIALSLLKDVVRRMSVMPGQRNMVVVSPGFLTPETDMLQDYLDMVERALHSEVMISTLDARGLYAHRSRWALASCRQLKPTPSSNLPHQITGSQPKN
jgi:hypothetical protein